MKASTITVILDGACHTNTGHNVDLCLRFAKEFASHGSEIEFLIAGKTKKIEHSKIGGIRKIPQLYPQLYVDSFKFKLLNKFYNIALILLRVIIGRIFDEIALKISYLELKNKLDEIKKERGGVNIKLFLPSADIYYSMAALKLLKKRGDLIVSLRFIGVMENVALGTKSLRRDLFRLIREINNEKLQLFAETQKYANHLSFLTCKNYKVSPYPFQKQTISGSEDYGFCTKFSAAYPLRILLPGKARLDKGTGEIEYMSNVFFANFGMKVIIESQTFAKGSRSYNQKLYKYSKINPNLEITNRQLPYSEFKAKISAAHVVLLPYDQLTYWMRGSAVFFESIELGKFLISRQGTAFADDFGHLGVTETYNGMNQLVSIVDQILSSPVSRLVNRADEQQAKYKRWYSCVSK